MKFNTEVTTRNWNNGWVDVNVRKPNDSDYCFILYRSKVVTYDIETLKSNHIEMKNGMGTALYKEKKWLEMESDSNYCSNCNWVHSGLDTNEFLSMFYDPMEGAKPTHGEKDGKDIITLPDYEILEKDEFEYNPNIFKLMFKFDNHERHAPYKHQYIQSSEVEILAWCSIPDDPINPFEKKEENKDV